MESTPHNGGFFNGEVFNECPYDGQQRGGQGTFGAQQLFPAHTGVIL